MRLSNTQAVSRPVPTDRNPTEQLNAFANILVPHASTQRYAYTVPAGRKAFIDLFFAQVIRSSAAAPVGIAEWAHNFTVSGNAAQTVDWLVLVTNGVNDNVTARLSQYGSMLAGDSIAAFSDDTSTGGTVTYRALSKLTVYDA